MMTHFYRQFERPHGPLGAHASFIMSHRPSNKERNRWTVELIAPDENAHVLEFGCGPGLALAAACERVTGGRIVGLDHSPLMLAQAAKRNRQAIEAGRLQLHLGDLDSLAQFSPQFDVVYSINVAMFWRDRASAFRSICGVTRPGGLLATTYQPRHSGAKSADAFKFAEGLCADMRELGFIDVRIEQLALQPLPAVCVLGRQGDR